MTKVCRLCMQVLNKSFINVDTIEHATGEKPYRKKIALVLPEVAIDITTNPLICFVCAQALHSAFVFKTQCLEVEKQVRAYVRDMAIKNDDFDLAGGIVKPFIDIDEDKDEKDTTVSDADGHDKKDDDDADDKEETYEAPSCSEEVIDHPYPTVKIEVSDLKYEEEIEFQDENEYQEEYESSQSAGNEEDPFLVMNTSFLCNFCGYSCNDQSDLVAHMTTHDALPQCPWCQRHFKSETFLNAHKNNCLKRFKIAKMKITKVTSTSSNSNDSNSICAKVPRLPRQAKHYLETWLYEHQDDPYPTDGEKLKMAEDTNLTLIQVQNWFINARRRILKGNYCKKYFRKKRTRPNNQLKVESVDVD